MDKKYSDAEQYSKHDRDGHDADNARILFLDYGFSPEQIRRLSETGYIFDWEGDARTDVAYCINNDLLPKHQRRLEASAKPMWEIPNNEDLESMFGKFGLVEDREAIQIAIAKFATEVALGWMVIPNTPSPLDNFHSALRAANCNDIEETITRILEAIQ